MSNSSIWSIDRILSGPTTLDQSEPENNGNEEVLHIPQNSSIIGTSPSNYSLSYWGYSFGRSYPSVEMQLVYSIASANWADFVSKEDYLIGKNGNINWKRYGNKIVCKHSGFLRLFRWCEILTSFIVMLGFWFINKFIYTVKKMHTCIMLILLNDKKPLPNKKKKTPL